MNVTIEKIEVASFGKLKNTFVSAEKGINILSAPNESGKSTLAAFIKFVFYGFAGTRLQTLSENEKRLYTPWDNETVEGSITVNSDGERYVIYRKLAPSGKETVSVTNRMTGKTEFAGEVPGEAFFGVSEEIFARTLFFRQLTVPQSKDEILADRLRNIAISADEQVGTKKALSRLTDCKNEIKGKAGNGLLPKAERERDSLEEKITESTELRQEALELREDIKKRSATVSDAADRLKELSEERRNIEKYEASLKLRTINRLTVEENLAREEYVHASAGLKQQADGGAFSLLSSKNAELVAEQRNCNNIAELLEEAEAELEECESLHVIDVAEAKKAQKLIHNCERNSKLFFAAAVLFTVVGLFVYIAYHNPSAFLCLAIAIILGACGGVLLGKPANLAKEYGLKNIGQLKEAILNLPALEARTNEAESRVEALQCSYDESRTNCLILKKSLDEEIGKYAEVSGKNYGEQIEHILSASAESGEKLAVWRAKKNELAAASEGIDVVGLTEEARGATKPERERAKVDREIAFYTQQYNQLSELNKNDEVKIAAIEARSGDPAVMVGKRDALNNRINELSIKHKAYETAIKTIEEASDYMKSMVAPRIGERADEYFTAATGGKYHNFEIDTRLSMSFETDFRRSCEFLSAGTRDSAYLSLRLALADMLFGGCGVPILLDDAFVRIDDSRLRMMAGALKEATKKHQIFILTHGEREQNAFDDIGLEYTNITMEKF